MKGILWITINSNNLPQGRYEIQPHSHVTLQFNVEHESVKHLVNKKVELFGASLHHSDEIGIEAIAILLSEEWKSLCKNPVPHITLSHRQGVKPAQSNAMLKGKNFMLPQLNLNLEGVTEFHEFAT